MYNIDFNKYTIDELKDFEKKVYKIIRTKENEEKAELLTNIIKLLREFEERFPGDFIAQFCSEDYYANEIIDELERYNAFVFEEEI